MTAMNWDALLREMNAATPWKWAIEYHHRIGAPGGADAPVRLKSQQGNVTLTFDPSTPPSFCLSARGGLRHRTEASTYVNVGMDGRLDPLARQRLKGFLVDLLAAETEEELLRQGGKR